MPLDEPSALQGRELLGKRREAVVQNPRPQAWTALAVLTAINLLNYIDRFVVPAVQESIKHSPLAPNDSQLGLLATAFLVVYMISAPVFGALSGRHSRPRVIALGVAIWSLATALGGLATTYFQLLAARATVGIGEAAYGTIAPAILADAFPERWRGRIFALFYMAIPVGSAMGFVLGGIVEHRYSWRAAFYVAGAPGLLFALFALFLRDPKRQDEARIDETPPAPRWVPRWCPVWLQNVIATYAPLFRIPAYLQTVLGYIAYTFAVGGIGVWMVTFLVRVRGLEQAAANGSFGPLLVLTGFGGTFIGGWVADSLAKRTKQANMWVSGVATLAAAPLAYLAFVTTDLHAFWVYIAIAEVLIFASTGPVNAAIVSDVPSGLRAAAMALSIFAIHALGDAISPYLIGKISDLDTLSHAVLVIPVAVLAAGGIWIYAALAGRLRRGDKT